MPPSIIARLSSHAIGRTKSKSKSGGTKVAPSRTKVTSNVDKKKASRVIETSIQSRRLGFGQDSPNISAVSGDASTLSSISETSSSESTSSTSSSSSLSSSSSSTSSCSSASSACDKGKYELSFRPEMKTKRAITRTDKDQNERTIFASPQSNGKMLLSRRLSWRLTRKNLTPIKMSPIKARQLVFTTPRKPCQEKKRVKDFDHLW